MPTELFTQLLVFLTGLLGFARYIIGVWFKMREKDKIIEHKLMRQTIERLDLSLKDIQGEFLTIRNEMKGFRNDLATIVKVQANNQKSFDLFVGKMSEFVSVANQRFEQLENFGKVKVKD